MHLELRFKNEGNEGEHLHQRQEHRKLGFSSKVEIDSCERALKNLMKGGVR